MSSDRYTGSHVRLWRAFWLAVFFLCAGTIGYVFIEGYSFLDALYMTVITISTVGFGEIRPLSEEGRAFTIILILSGVSGLAYAVGSITELILERATDPNLWKKPMEKKIAHLTGHTIICGSGRVGSAAASELQKSGASFVIIESHEERIKDLQEQEYLYMQGDATRESVLLRSGIKKASSLLAMLDSDPDNLFTVLTARELNPTLQIIARCENFSAEKRILRAGADSIVSPFVSAGKLVAERVLASSSGGGIIDRVLPTLPPRWLTPEQTTHFMGKTISEVEESLAGTVVGLRLNGVDTIMPSAGDVIERGVEILAIAPQSGTRSNEQKPVVRPTLVLIDDNPVICRLYTRLFQKAGYFVSTAKTGSEGIALVREKKPDAIIVDFHLPDFSGLEVSRQIRKIDGGGVMKIILFTADNDTRTRDAALSAGVDSVVVKSPDANEIVSQVQKVLALKKF